MIGTVMTELVGKFLVLEKSFGGGGTVGRFNDRVL